MCSKSTKELNQLLKEYTWDFMHMANRSKQEGYVNMKRAQKELDRRAKNATMYSAILCS